ncbi:MAG TPA: thiol-disulfide isomerase [Bryobacteraceae bacterium]|nr:thiol-disulfide isomerase [Bryobacteraceae bacterium]
MKALILLSALSGSYAAAADSSVTFHKDVLPILQQHCQTCHRPGSIAPMSFLTYQSTRPWAKAMKAAVLSRKMPPWSADPGVGHFSNDPSLKSNELEIISKWADNGAPSGDEKDAPPPLQWPANGWTAQPDIVLKGVPYAVPAHPKNDVVEWMTLITPTGFTKDMWITSVEIKPSELGVTHHICVSFVPHRPNVSYNTLLWVDKQRDDAGVEVAPEERKFKAPTADGAGIELPGRVRNRVGANSNGDAAGAVGVGFTCYVPGRALSDFRPYHAALLVPAGYDLSWTIHYTPNGTELTDRPEIGLTVAKTEPERLLIESFGGTDPAKFAIPPNDGNYAPAPSEATFLVDAELVWMSPHMHLRGKDMTYKLVFPDGKEQMILNVPHYDFNWQLGYSLDEPIKVPKGSKLIVSGHYDNSANNKFNPDPSRTVYQGNMTWEEMFAPFFAIVVDKSVNPATALKIPFATGGA